MREQSHRNKVLIVAVGCAVLLAFLLSRGKDQERGDSAPSSSAMTRDSAGGGNAFQKPDKKVRIDAADAKAERLMAILKATDQTDRNYGFQLREVARLLAQTDPERGYDWLRSLDRSMINTPAFSSFFAYLARDNPDLAIRWVDELEFEAGKKAAAFSATGAIAIENPARAWELLDHWKNSVQDVNYLRGLVLQTVGEISGIEDAWNLIHTNSDAASPMLIDCFFRAVKFSSGEEALDFVFERTDEATEASALFAVVKNWSPSSVSSIENELSSREVDARYDPAYQAMAERLLVTEPVRAAEWAVLVSDVEVRKSLRSKISGYVLRQDKSIHASVESVFNQSEGAGK